DNCVDVHSTDSLACYLWILCQAWKSDSHQCSPHDHPRAKPDQRPRGIGYDPAARTGYYRDVALEPFLVKLPSCDQHVAFRRIRVSSGS
ncbi:MAG: hypothetical protein ACP5JG_14830, partial [Anaerolineae bacterium]